MLNLLFLLLGIAGGFGIVYAADISYWWAVAIIPATVVFVNLFYLVFLLFASWCIPPREPKKTSKVARGFMYYTMDWMMRIFRVNIRLKGQELFPNEPMVLVSNHLSDFDPMTMVAVLKHRNFAYISKESNFQIPIAGRFARAAGYLPIDRENGMKALRTLKKASERMINEGLDFGIYPEGTRSKTGELLPFKTGAFYLAKKANAPIVIMVTCGTADISRRAIFHKTEVLLDVVKFIDKETVQNTSMEDLAELCRNTIAEYQQANQ